MASLWAWLWPGLSMWWKGIPGLKHWDIHSADGSERQKGGSQPEPEVLPSSLNIV